MARPPVKKDPFEEMAASLPDFDREHAVTLRQMAMRDPIPGAPMQLQLLPGGETEWIEPGQWMAKGAVDGSTGLPFGCPVIPLGKDGQTCWFLDTLGAVVSLEASASGKGPIGALFAGRSRFLEWAWPRWNAPKKDEDFRVIGWQADDARQALVDACAFTGQFSLEDQVRGRGAWRDIDNGLIYHAGDEVWIGGKWRPCGMHGGFIYPARKKIGRPSRGAHKAGPGSAGDHLLELMRTFNWDRGDFDAHLMLGWIITAKMGGALHQRPVSFVTGGEGSGKTTLQGLARFVMNGGLIKTSNTTAAGIYQRLREDSVAILVDELEGSQDPRTSQKILELARIAYSGDSLNRGGDKGVAREFKLQSSFMGSAISMPALDAQDASRMAILMLRERESAGGKLDVDVATLEAIGRHLLRRIFDRWGEWDGLVNVFRAAMIAVGHTDRAGDTFAPLAAGAHLALNDHAPTADDLAMWQRWLDPRDLAETAGREKTWRRCLSHLIEAQPGAFASPTFTHKSVAQVLDAFRSKRGADETDVDNYLRKVGLAFSWPKDEFRHEFETGRLFVPSKHPALHDLFEGTQWAGRQGAPGPWAGVLKQMPRDLWKKGASEKGLDRMTAGTYINLAAALEA